MHYQVRYGRCNYGALAKVDIAKVNTLGQISMLPRATCAAIHTEVYAI